ncbi:retrovirus-related pol polyprotein from transposon TNT 1-94 [Tanacetum coccineum]
MKCNRKLFSSYKAYNKGNVIFGSNLRCNIIGKGQICDNKCRVTFSEHDSKITKDGKVIGRGIRKKGLYVMKLGNKPKDQVCLAMIDENSMLWHRRLGHANMRLIQSLASKELVRNLPKLKYDQHFCDAWKIGKQAHASHKAKILVSKTRCLELLYMDPFGPSAVRSYRGNRYTLVIVDDYSRNKLDENGIVSRNKARLVGQGYNQQEGIDYDETYALIARFESIRILLAYACALDFKLFQMDVKSAFLNGFINEEGACVFTDKWSLDELEYGVPTDDPYQTNPPPDDIISSIRINQEGQVCRICYEEEIDVHEYQILTRKIVPTLKPLEEIIRENVFCLGGNQDHVPACLCYMLYCVVHSKKFNLAYYMAKRIEWVTKQKRLILPYGMLLNHLFKLIMNENHDLYNESYVLYDRVMNLVAAQQEQNTRKDRGTRRGRHSTFSFAFDQPSFSHLNDDDDDDGNGERTSRASTPSPIHYVNLLTNESTWDD